MNIENVRRKNRKAISPVLATVILIAITLIAAVAIAGFVFGLFGSFTSSAQVSAQVTSCKAGAGSAAHNNECTVTLTNTGTSNVSLAATNAQTIGSQAVGSISLSNGASVPFSGVWS